ncbi:hypothetical protein ZWY2020_054296 [Hordeum vulgare]|nr:hypothetical protein ZWY2020_054296 [Hordeum vulgare]
MNVYSPSDHSLTSDFCGGYARGSAQHLWGLAWSSSVRGTRAFGVLAARKKAFRSASKVWKKKHWFIPTFDNDCRLLIDLFGLWEESHYLFSDEADLRCDARLALAASIRRRGKRRAIREGDENTRFFHAAASHWRRRSTIRTLEVEVVLVVDHARKAAALLDYYSGQLGRGTVYRFVLAALYANARLVLGPPQLAPIEPDDVKAVVVALDRTSEPSHDGLGPAFYQAAWGW